MTTVALVGGAALAVGLVVFGLTALRLGRAAPGVTVVGEGPAVPKEKWTMPPLALLAKPEWSTGRKVAMLTSRAYLVISMI